MKKVRNKNKTSRLEVLKSVMLENYKTKLLTKRKDRDRLFKILKIRMTPLWMMRSKNRISLA